MSGIVLRFKTIFLLAGIVAFILSVYAEQYIELFDQQGNYKQDYDQLISNLRKDDVLKMPDGKRYKVIKTMSGGSVTSVIQAIPLDLKLDRGHKYVALRLPRQINSKNLTFYHDYIDTLEDMKKTNLNVPQFYVVNEQYMAAEFIEHRYNALSFFLDEMNDDELWKKAAKSLKKYGIENADIVHVSDIRSEQLLYEEKKDRWRLVDWSDGYISHDGKNIREHLFTLTKIPKDIAAHTLDFRTKKLIDEISDQIEEKRMLDYLKKKSTADQSVSNLAQVLKSEGDYKKVFGVIIKNNSTSYNQAFIRYITRKDKDLFVHFANEESIKKLMVWMDENIKGIGENGYPLLKAKLLDRAYMNKVINENEFTSLLDDIFSKMLSSEEIEKLKKEFRHRKTIIDESKHVELKPKGFLNRCLRAILGEW